MYRSQAMLNKIVLLFTLRILSYFTLFPDSVFLTQAIKSGLRVLLTMAAFLMLKSLRDKYKSHSLTFQNLTPLMLYGSYLLLGLLSVAWAALPQYALLQLSMIVESLAFAWFFTQLLVFYNTISDHHARFALVFGRAALFICIGFLIGMYADPDTFFRKTHEGEVSRLGGIIINPNELGMLAVLLGVMGFAELLDKRSRAINILTVAISIAVVLYTQSRSSLLAFLFVSAIFIIRNGNLRLIIFSTVAASIALPYVFYAIILKQGDINEVMSMTGRLPFWKDLLTEGFTQRPLFGYGFMCIADGEYFHSVHSYSAKMTHNTFAQVLLNLGLVGFFIIFLQMMATFFTIVKNSESNYRVLTGMMLVPLLINSFTEFGIFGESNYGIQFYQLIILLFVVKTVPTTYAQPVQFGQPKMVAT